MVNYADGKIYRIVCNTTGLTYYGSTTQLLYKRLHEHKKLKCSSKIIIEGENYDIILVDDIITSGATLKEAELILKNAGACRVIKVALAKG